MFPATAKRTAQILPPGIAGIREKINPAVTAPRLALAQPRLVPHTFAAAFIADSRFWRCLPDDITTHTWVSRGTFYRYLAAS
jgi:hypothetical protein